jgi:hypothetical protein
MTTTPPYLATRQDRLMHVSFVLSALLVMVAIVWIVVGLWPRTVIRVDGTRVTAVSATLRAGAILSYDLTYCKFIDVDATVNRSWVNDTVTMTPTTGSNLAMGCHTVPMRVVVPGELAPGHYRLHVSMRYDVTALYSTTVSYDVGPMVILP